MNFEVVVDGNLSICRNLDTVNEPVQDVPKCFFVIELKADEAPNFSLESV